MKCPGVPAPDFEAIKSLGGLRASRRAYREWSREDAAARSLPLRQRKQYAFDLALRFRRAVAGLPVGEDVKRRLLTHLDRHIRAIRADGMPFTKWPALVVSARAFRIAIDALPIGRDRRTSLLAYLDAYVAEVEGVAAAC